MGIATKRVVGKPGKKKAPAKKSPAKKASGKKDEKEKKAPSAYMNFCKKERAGIVKANPDASFGEIGKLLGEKWRGMTDAQKGKFK